MLAICTCIGVGAAASRQWLPHDPTKLRHIFDTIRCDHVIRERAEDASSNYKDFLSKHGQAHLPVMIRDYQHTHRPDAPWQTKDTFRSWFGKVNIGMDRHEREGGFTNYSGGLTAQVSHWVGLYFVPSRRLFHYSVLPPCICFLWQFGHVPLVQDKSNTDIPPKKGQKLAGKRKRKHKRKSIPAAAVEGSGPRHKRLSQLLDAFPSSTPARATDTDRDSGPLQYFAVEPKKNLLAHKVCPDMSDAC